ncbi:molybdopterin molybdotransferase MoeA [Falsiroseomonas ponticola]|uniref:molybdopterin molybdotransferase MoeA n=1 Tax=Falsiroseomonas ponticola TaxID=2786951 RepID=UPI001931F343|nr:gephyrin-like molybdotransferase Glp [Roseomonas ponticola]
MPDGSRVCGCDEQDGLIAPDVALRILLDDAAPVAREATMPATAALGRVLARAVVAECDLPPFDQAAMDGFGFTAADCAADVPPRLGRRIAAGDAPGTEVAPGEAVRILTGAAVPAGVAAVLMEEHAAVRAGQVRARRRPRLGQNIRRRGEDVTAGTEVLAPGTRLGARHVALLAALGVPRVHVRDRVRVALLSNGNELDGRQGLRDSNRPMLRAVLAGQPAEVEDLGLLPDDPVRLAAALRETAARADLILASGGVSGSDADYLPAALAAAGGEVEVLRLAQKPGKPLAHGRLGAARCLFLPGNPVAALVGMLTLGLPLLHRLAGLHAAAPRLTPCVLAEGFARQPGRVEYVPVRTLGETEDGLLLVERTGPAGSARLLPLAAAEGLLRVPAALDSVPVGSRFGMLPLQGIA